VPCLPLPQCLHFIFVSNNGTNLLVLSSQHLWRETVFDVCTQLHKTQQPTGWQKGEYSCSNTHVEHQRNYCNLSCLFPLSISLCATHNWWDSGRASARVNSTITPTSQTSYFNQSARQTTATLLTEKNPNPVGCPYVYSSVVNHGYIALLHNMSDLNDVFCAPLR